MRIRTSTAPAALVAGALLLTACGGSPLESKTGTEVAELSADALEEAGSVRMAGTITQDGQETELDLRLQADRSAGTITVQGTEVELISIGANLYLKATAELLASFGAPAEAFAQFEDRWIMVPPEGAAGFEDFTMDGLIEQMRSTDMDEEETRSEELLGDDVVIVEQEDGVTLVVADDEPPHLLQIQDFAGSEGTMTLSDHGEEEDISVPDDVVGPEELEGS